MNKDTDLVLIGGWENNLMAMTYSNGKLGMLWNIDVGGRPRSVDFLNDKILLGLKNGSIVEIPMSEKGNAAHREVMASHCDGEVWGLEVVSLPGGEVRVITSADDNRLIVYNAKTHERLAEGHVGAKNAAVGKKASKKKRRGGRRGGRAGRGGRRAVQFISLV